MSESFLSTVLLLLLLLDPIGNIPLLISLLKHLPPSKRRHIILRESGIATITLILCVITGERILSAMRLSAPAVEISGGIILFLIALRMVFPSSQPIVEGDEISEPLIVPIAIPMIVGPATLATVILSARQSKQDMLLIIAILTAVAINTVILLSTNRLAKLFGKAGMDALERLMGLVLTAMSVQMLISGSKMAFNTAH